MKTMQLNKFGRTTPHHKRFWLGLTGEPVGSRFQDRNLSLSIDINNANKTPINQPPKLERSPPGCAVGKSAAIAPKAVKSVVVPTDQSFSGGALSPSCLPSLFARTPINTKMSGTPII
jgi:hypothetical protein